MTKYLFKRILHGLLSVVAVVAIVMILIFVFTDREKIFNGDTLYTKKINNEREIYCYSQWEKYGYLDYVQYTDYLMELTASGEMTEETRAEAAQIARKKENDSELVSTYVQKFTEEYESRGYTVVRRDAKMVSSTKLANGGRQQLFAYKDVPVLQRLGSFFGNLIQIDNIHYVKEDIEDRGLTFTMYDPVYNTEAGTGEQTKTKFSPAIMGNGTRHKYLVYFDSTFPYVHQNLVTVRLGTSYSVARGVDVFDTMVNTQGAGVYSMVTYPTGVVERRADDLHTATYVAGSRDSSTLNQTFFTDDYTNVKSVSQNKSRLGYSFVIGIIASILAYCVALPIGIMMARRKDKLLDKIGTLYIIFILACPSLAYIFMVQALGRAAGLPHYFNLEAETALMYILPIVSLAMPTVAGLMKWLRRYMIDQMNSDYVKFARSGGLSEGEIFRKHIFKNAAIPIIHGIPGSLLGALVGAIITEKIYYVPGVGNLLTNAISLYDNAVIVGLTLFYALISITAIILGDILMAMTDPRISFSSKSR